MQQHVLRWSGVLGMGFALGGALIAAEGEPVAIRFQPDWFSNAQFSGFFWAETAGLYAEEGMEVEFASFDFGVDFLGEVVSGRAAFGTAEAYILLDAIAQGAPLVAIGAVLGESPAGYISLASTGIESAADLSGKRVGVHAYAEKLLPFFVAEAGLPPDSVEVIEVQHHLEVLLDGSLDLHQGYAIDEMIRLQAQTGEKVEILLFEEMGFPMYSMVVYTSAAFLEANPKAVEAFLRASAAGWEAAMAAPEIAALVVNGPFRDDRVEAERIATQAIALKPFVLRPERPTLSMTREKWEAMHAVFLRSGMIPEPVDLDGALWFPGESRPKTVED